MESQLNHPVSVQSFQYRTAGNITVQRQVEALPYEGAMDTVLQNIDTHRGAIFASGYEYPGRYSRWDVGFIDPPIEFIAQGRKFSIHALNKRGIQLIQIFNSMLQHNTHLVSLYLDNQSCSLQGVIREMPEVFFEEDRSKQPTVFSILRALIVQLYACEDEHLGFYGAFGYDLVFQFTPIEFKRKRTNNDLHLFLPDELYVVDHRREESYRLRYEFSANGLATMEYDRTGVEFSLWAGVASLVSYDHGQGEYAAKVQQVINGTKAGDFFEVVLSQELLAGFTGTPRKLFELIRQCNPSPYEFIINIGGEQLIGASPEMFVRVDGQQVETCPISGTIRRGRNPVEDADQILTLLNSLKDRAELDMCTDVDRNDKSLVCKPGTVKIVGRRMIEKYSKLFHTVDHVVGTLRDGFDGIDAILAHMWAVTLTGAPKRAAMQMIEKLENSPRGWYGGCIGMLLFNGTVNTGITIRTVFLREGLARIRVGATLLHDSVPEEEECETRLKAEAFINAVLGISGVSVVKSTSLSEVGKGKVVLFVNNYDSFVHTLAGYVRQTGAEVKTVVADLALQILEQIAPNLVFISPGPGWPKDFGVPTLVKVCVERGIPIFGVCLGLQGMVEAFGGELGVLDVPVHGKASIITCSPIGIFTDFPETFIAGRYHSLHALQVPDCFKVTAWTEDGIVMAIQHRELPIAAVQFHPESLLTLHDDLGLKLIFKVIEKLTA